VEDDPRLCEFICEVLTSADLEVEAITDSAEAATRINTEKFSAVFLDLRMPAPDGIELTRQIRSNRLNRVTPVIIVTGETQHGLMAKAFQAGVSFFLHKPIDRTKLLRLVSVTQGSIENERRRFHRSKVTCKVSITNGSDRLEAKTLDVSLKGMLVETPRALVVGASVNVAVELSAGAAPIRASTRVVRLVGQDCAGLEIQNMNSEDVLRWQDFLLPHNVPNTMSPIR
jgi:DNA-binding response OmpR family regulator